jgi:hypothetical protein
MISSTSFYDGVITVKHILQREFGIENTSQGRVPHFLTDAQKVAHVEASNEMLGILHAHSLPAHIRAGQIGGQTTDSGGHLQVGHIFCMILMFWHAQPYIAWSRSPCG